MSIDTASAEAPAGSVRSSRHPRWVAGLVVLAVLVAIGWAWRHPSQSFDGGYGLEPEGPHVGTTVWTSLIPPGTPGADEVTIRELEPDLDRDEAAVTFDYVICELDPEALEREGVGAFGYGLAGRDVERVCAATRPAVGSTFRLRSDPPEELIVGITPTRRGRTVVNGYRMSFDVGWQVGHADLLVETTLDVRD